jgi:hypothetical protein
MQVSQSDFFFLSSSYLQFENYLNIGFSELRYTAETIMIYTVLMVFGKCATSVWLFAFPILSKFIRKFRSRITQPKRRAQGDNIPMQNPPTPIPPIQTVTDSEMTPDFIISDGLMVTIPTIFTHPSKKKFWQ